jgi:hypothetical protein
VSNSFYWFYLFERMLTVNVAVFSVDPSISVSSPSPTKWMYQSSNLHDHPALSS